MTRRNRQDLAPSLFPFLAVLICTLGTLILLLALLVQKSADLAEQTSREELARKTAAIDPDSQQLSQSQATEDFASIQLSRFATNNPHSWKSDETS